MGILSQWAAWDGIGIGELCGMGFERVCLPRLRAGIAWGYSKQNRRRFSYGFLRLCVSSICNLFFFNLLALIQLRCFVRHLKFKYCDLFHTIFQAFYPWLKPTSCQWCNQPIASASPTLPLSRFLRPSDLADLQVGTASEGLSCLNPRSNYFNN